MRKRLLIAALLSGVVTYILTICCYASSPFAASQQNKDSLRRPHGKLFYLYSKKVDINTKAQVLKAYNLIERGEDYPMAIAILNQVIAVSPENSEAYLLRAICYTETEKFKEAEEDYKNALRIEPENPTFYKYRGQSFLMWHDYAERKGIYYTTWKEFRLSHAERMYKKALEIEPYYIDGIVGLGDTYAGWGKYFKKKSQSFPKAIEFYKQAIDEYNKVLALFPEHGPVVAKKEDAKSEIEFMENAEREAKRKRAIEERIK